MEPAPAKVLYRFGVFDADPSTGELRKQGMRIRLQEQPFQVLLLLLERRGDLVTREELRQKLWPADTFVDFDHSLNTAINKLRDTLGDSASSPRFIETLARRGYRFLAPVEKIGGDDSGPKPSDQSALPETGDTAALAAASPLRPTSGQFGGLLTTREELPAVSPGYVRVPFLLIQIMYLCFYAVALTKLPQVGNLLDQAFTHSNWIVAVLMITALVGIPIRLYLIAAVAFNVKSLATKFLKLFPFTFPLDEIWALSPLLLLPQMGVGLSLAAVAALIYVPFSQRTLMLMAQRR